MLRSCFAACVLLLPPVALALSSQPWGRGGRAASAARGGGESGIGEGDAGCLDAETFECFAARYQRPYRAGTAEHAHRRALFERRVEEIREINYRRGRRWTAAVNQLTDRSDEELAGLRGRRRGIPSAGTGAGDGLSMLATGGRAGLPENVSWLHLQAMQEVQDQGSCGSCWATAVTTALRAHAAIYSADRTFSTQQLISCVPNPEHCGGEGGCEGSTAELAMDYVLHNGLGTEESLAYQGLDTACPEQMLAAASHPVPQPMSGNGSGPAMAFGMFGWRRLPANRQEPLMRSLYVDGPVAVSVSATAFWDVYGSGILDQCSRNAVVNHLVVLVGFGRDEGAKYWHLQNSWSTSWGENGYIRLLRSDDEETNHCGWDEDPQVGTGCVGGPTREYVCGMCGILYDSVVPHFTGTSSTAAQMLARRQQVL